VESAGDPSFPHSVVGVAAKGRSLPSEELSAVLAEWSRRWVRPLPWPHARSWKGSLEQLLVPLTPPVLLDVYRRLRRPAAKR
jgi:hypothetical protein